MNKMVFMFCGVESTGKTTAVKKIVSLLRKNNLKVKVVSEVGRDICAQSGGVDEMSLDDYEQILFTHQTNFIEAFRSDCDVIIMDTDSTYTRYYLEKDKFLYQSNKKRSDDIVSLSESITKMNLLNHRIHHVFYLNSDCEFVQDGTRTYEETRKQDDCYLYKLYKRIYGCNCTMNVIDGCEYDDRFDQILSLIDKYLNKKVDNQVQIENM